MFAKILVLIIIACTTAGGLLVIRQQRISTAHELAILHRSLENQRRTVQDLHVMLQDRLNLTQIRALITRYENQTGTKMVPFRLEECLLRCDPANRPSLPAP